LGREDPAARAHRYLETLCGVKPNRRTGSAGNRAATDFFADAIRAFGYEIDATPFPCLDYVRGESLLVHGPQAFHVEISPYSTGCDVLTEMVVASTVDELEAIDCEGKILLMKGALCAEQLMPKGFVFYNPEHHQRIVALLEAKKPAGIVTSTRKNPEQVGALYPFPLIADGDFQIPSVYCGDEVGEVLAGLQGEVLHLKIAAQRLSSSAANVIARSGRETSKKMVLTAHIDAYEESPGASDNASGTAVLLLLAEMLAGYAGPFGIEFAALNGEDHYSAAGQMDYLKRYGSELDCAKLAINIDDVGCKGSRTAYSFYDCPPELQHSLEGKLLSVGGLVRGEPWFNGDHMVFVQNGVPSLAFTSENSSELMKTVTHTSLDAPELIDPRRLVELAWALNSLIRSLQI